MTQQRVKQKRFLLFGNYLKNPAKPWEYTSGDVKIAPLWVACFNLLVWQELLKDWWALPFWRRQRGRWFLRKTKINLYEGIWRCSSMDGLMVPKGPWSHFFWNNFSTKKKQKRKRIPPFSITYRILRSLCFDSHRSPILHLHDPALLSDLVSLFLPLLILPLENFSFPTPFPPPLHFTVFWLNEWPKEGQQRAVPMFYPWNQIA